MQQTKSTTTVRAPRRFFPPYENIEMSDSRICDYSWLINLAACGISLCTMLIVIIFFIWSATRPV